MLSRLASLFSARPSNMDGRQNAGSDARVSATQPPLLKLYAVGDSTIERYFRKLLGEQDDTGALKSSTLGVDSAKWADLIGADLCAAAIKFCGDSSKASVPPGTSCLLWSLWWVLWQALTR